MNPAYSFYSHEEIEGIKGGVVCDVWNASIDTEKTILAICVKTETNEFTLMFDEEGNWHYKDSALCKVCDTTNDPDAVFCKKCGARLPERVEQHQEDDFR